MKTFTFLFSAAILALTAGTALAVKPVNTTFTGVAIKGYDPVAYFTRGEPVKGSKAFSYEWHGATWRFASAEHRDTFKADPEKYSPQYGGYCAYAVSQGTTANIDPDAWKIVDGKLYLQYSQKIMKKWEEDVPGYISKADEEWPKLVQGEE